MSARAETQGVTGRGASRWDRYAGEGSLHGEGHELEVWWPEAE